MIILLHSSKTMRSPAPDASQLLVPALSKQAQELAHYVQTLSAEQLAATMRLSSTLAQKTHQLFADWTLRPERQSLAIDSFIGDIYSGLRASTLGDEERQYANEHLRILSGLYGIVRPFDGICPYRLEMGYKFPDPNYANLYNFWGDAIARTLPTDGLIINLAAVEYSRTVTPYVDPKRIITPKFLTVDPKTNEPTFVVVHAKIARGAFARWLVTTRSTEAEALRSFNDIGYAYNATLSTPAEPVFVCTTFQGKGLSMRLQK